MKKRVIGGLLVIALMFGGFMGVSQYHPEERSIIISNDNIAEVEEASEFQVEAKAAVLMDASSGSVLFAQNAKEELPPASVTKVMTMLLILRGCEEEKISLQDIVTVSENAASMGGSQMYLEPGEQHTVDELMMGVAMVSANDGCVALAEHLCGSVEMFVEKMNRTAAELNMQNTNFVNTNGLPVANHYSSAYDIAIMTKELLSHEESHRWLTQKQKMIKVGLPGKEKDFELINTNKLLRQYDGAIGVKTGFTQDAMYCLSGAAERNGTRFIVVILGSETSAIRFAEAKKLLDYGFSNYENVTVAEKDKVHKSIKVDKGVPEKVEAVTREDYGVLVKKGEGESIETRVEWKASIEAPIKKGEKLGELVVYRNGIARERFPLVARKAVKKASMKDLYIRMIKKIA